MKSAVAGVETLKSVESNDNYDSFGSEAHSGPGKLRFPNAPKTFLSKGRRQSGTKLSQPDILERALNPGSHFRVTNAPATLATSSSISKSQLSQPSIMRSGRGNRLTKETNLFSPLDKKSSSERLSTYSHPSFQSLSMPYSSGDVRPWPGTEDKQEKPAALPKQHGVDQKLKNMNSKGLVKAKASKVNEPTQFKAAKTLNLLEQFDNALKRAASPTRIIKQSERKKPVQIHDSPSSHILDKSNKASNVLGGVKNSVPRYSKKNTEARSIVEKLMKTRSTRRISKQEIKERVELLKNEIMGEMDRSEHNSDDDPREKFNGSSKTDDNSLKAMNSRINAILKDIMPDYTDTKKMKKGMKSTFDAMGSLSMDIPSERSLAMRPFTSHHKRSLTIRPTKKNKPMKKHLEKLKSEFEGKMNSIATLDTEKLLPVPDMEDRYNVLQMKNLSVKELEKANPRSRATSRGSLKANDEMEELDKRLAEEHDYFRDLISKSGKGDTKRSSWLKLKQEFSAKMLKASESGEKKVKKISDEEFIFLPKESNSQESLSSNEELATAARSLRSNIGNKKGEAMEKWIADSGVEMSTDINNNEVREENRKQKNVHELLRKLDEATENDSSETWSAVDFFTRDNKWSLSLEPQTPPKKVDRSSGDLSGYLPRGTAGKTIMNAARPSRNPGKVANSLSTLISMKSKKPVDLTGVNDSKASDFLGFWSEKVTNSKEDMGIQFNNTIEEDVIKKSYQPIVPKKETIKSDVNRKDDRIRLTPINEDSSNLISNNPVGDGIYESPRYSEAQLETPNLATEGETSSVDAKTKDGRSSLETESDQISGTHESIDSLVSTRHELDGQASIIDNTDYEPGDYVTPRDLKFTPDMSFTERLMLKKLRGLQRDWTKETAKKEAALAVAAGK